MFFISSSLVNESFTWYSNLGWQFLFVLFLFFTHWKYDFTVFWLLLVLRNKSGKYALCFWRLPSPCCFKNVLFVSGFLQFHDVSRCGFLFIYLNEIARNSWFCGLMFSSVLEKISAIISSNITSAHSLFAFLLELQLNVCWTFSLCTVSLILSSFVCSILLFPLHSGNFFWPILQFIYSLFMYNLLLKLFSVFLILFISSGIFTVF